MKLLQIHDLALAELIDARRRYDEESNDLAERFLLEVDRICERILFDPESYPIVSRGFRLLQLRDFPYHVIYRLKESNIVEIVAVAHHSRKPGYWAKRS